jgi:hypothetical protein
VRIRPVGNAFRSKTLDDAQNTYSDYNLDKRTLTMKSTWVACVRAEGLMSRADSRVDVNGLIDMLRDPHSARRRSAAKKLRAAGQPSAAPALRDALREEVKDRRTWETQYQLVMALAACDTSADARQLVETLFAVDLEPMVHVAAGDAAVRLHSDIDAAVLAALNSQSVARVEGAIRALAMTQAVPGDAVVQSVIAYAPPPNHPLVLFWVAAAAAGWPPNLVKDFLDSCLVDASADTRRAAQASLTGRYLRWNPL